MVVSAVLKDRLPSLERETGASRLGLHVGAGGRVWVRQEGRLEGARAPEGGLTEAAPQEGAARGPPLTGAPGV